MEMGVWFMKVGRDPVTLGPASGSPLVRDQFARGGDAFKVKW